MVPSTGSTVNAWSASRNRSRACRRPRSPPRRGRARRVRAASASVIRTSASWSATVTRSPGFFSVIWSSVRVRNRGLMTSSATSCSSWRISWVFTRERLAVEPLPGHELRDGLAAQLRGLLDRSPERDDRGDGVLLRDTEQLLDLRLLGDGHGREGAAETLLARGEQHVPDQRVHRGATRPCPRRSRSWSVAATAPRSTQTTTTTAGGEHRRDGSTPPRSPRSPRRSGPGGAGVPRDLAGRRLGGVAADRRLVELGQRLPGGPVGDQHQVRTLPVAAARREPGVVEDPAPARRPAAGRR